MHPLLRLPFAGAIISLGFATVAAAQPAPAGASPAGNSPMSLAEARLIPATGRPIVLEVNKGTLVHLARPANTVFVADPDIADVQVKSPELVYIAAKSPGATVIYAVDANDNVLLNSPVRVVFDVSELRRSIEQLAPGTLISADTAGTNLVLSGKVGDAGQAEKVQALAAAVVGGVKGGKVINKVSVTMPNQVNLRVRIAEVDRNILKQIGVDWSKFGATTNEVTFLTQNSFAPPTNLLTIGKFLPGAVQATISALATEGFLTILAEPNLTTVSGETASFLAGGQFPYEVAQPGGVAGSAIYTVQFQPYGVQLAFTPTVIDADHLNLKVAPALSELDFTNVATVNGAIQPGLIVRQAQTTVELASGQSFALAGLLRRDTTHDIRKVPWLGDIPILGALFRSNKFQNNETELVVIVTPYLVAPQTIAAAAPTDGFEAPHDAQQVLYGDTWRRGLPAPASGPFGAGGSGLIGPAGFRLD